MTDEHQVNVFFASGPHKGKTARIPVSAVGGSHVTINGRVYKIVDGPIAEAVRRGVVNDHLALALEFVGAGPG